MWEYLAKGLLLTQSWVNSEERLPLFPASCPHSNGGTHTLWILMSTSCMYGLFNRGRSDISAHCFFSSSHCVSQNDRKKKKKKWLTKSQTLSRRYYCRESVKLSVSLRSNLKSCHGIFYSLFLLLTHTSHFKQAITCQCTRPHFLFGKLLSPRENSAC